MSYREREIRDEQKLKQKLADFAGDMGDDDLFAKYNYCTWIPQHLDNSTEICWYVHTDLAFFAKVISAGIIVTLGLVGNILLALTILSSKRLSGKSVNFFIVVLSISNILCFLLVAPFTVHNVLFVQYDSPVSKIDPCLLQGYIRHGAIIMPVSTTGHGRHGAILWGTQGYILGGNCRFRV